MKKLVLFLSLVPVFLFSQTGPGGVLNNTNNVFWLKADAGVYNDAGITLATNGQSIRQWNDNSGNTKHFSEGSVGQQPIFTTNVMNGFPVARFDGGNDRLSNLTITSGNSANFFTVVRYSSTPTPNPGILQGSPTGSLLSTGANDKVVGMWLSNTNRPWGRGIQTNNTSQNIPTVATTAINTNYIIENQYNGTTINQYVNATVSGSVGYDGTLKSWTEFAIGRQGTETWAGDIAEVIAFNTSINLAQRNIVNNYLSSKYNIAIAAASDLYSGDTGANGNYDFEVGGIGQSSAGNSNNSFLSSVSGGMGITYVSGFQDGDYILTGHNLLSNNNSTTSDCAGMTGTQNQRWIRIWYVDVTNTGANIVSNVKFDMSDGGVGAVVPANPSNYVLLYRAGTSGNWTESSIVPTISGDEITFSGVVFTDGYYTIGTKNASASPLPIELVHFSGNVCNNQVCLEWLTASESNNDYYTIERSSDGINFHDFLNVDSKAINGNSETLLSYSANDIEPLDGLSYYRLKQIDFNQTVSYSNIISVNFSSEKAIKFNVFPNPSSGEFFIDVNGAQTNLNLEVKISDLLGRKVYSSVFTLPENNLNQIKVVPDNLIEEGVYICTLAYGESTYNVRIIFQ